ncbi:hypothetical protein P7D73_18105 [Enterococcus raffinosus]|jgi:hypothetical protein|uniref:Uncharacterized protein n=1 Tax=Enterococcus avium TaxID=33945 RepID=A0ABD5F2X0_ENTAV|nr:MULTISPECIES: hypothetical protein [Enterococcus]MDT2382398.1 hypothetical protein [Enterococcus avium]MDT2437918.1 hypothetical protein [Enterococcus avium]MDT2451038.1 hypothetical protein [Enterococcus avium]MDT2484013.1 hypothetical protein [Enterococcus avium]MDT2510569.1 hypothetical protein [Enterococcus avium]
MGLDIEAYKKMKKVAYPERDVDGGLVDWENLVEIDQSTLDYTEQYFKGRTQGLVAGVYSPDDSLRFRAGAYSYYNRFREKLENIASNSQLFELIMFSDCEGFIGPIVSKKLAKDFSDLEETAREKLDEYDFETYLNFKKAFELASEEGCVQFM